MTTATTPLNSARGTALDKSSTGQKFNRYLVVTVVASPTNLAIYAAFLAYSTWHPNLANLAAATIVTIPTYFANRRWVWGLKTRHSFRNDIAPYWTATAINVAASSLVVWFLEISGASNTVLVLGTLAAYTIVWLARFFFLDRVLFTPAA